jgi:hypothetical protein
MFFNINNPSLIYNLQCGGPLLPRGEYLIKTGCSTLLTYLGDLYILVIKNSKIISLYKWAPGQTIKKV